MAVIYEKDGKRMLALKGATEVTLDNCVDYITEDGSKRNIDEEFRARLEQAIAQFSEATLRTLLVAEKEYP